MVGCKIILGFDSWSGFGLDKDSIWATTYEFTQCGVLTSVYSDKHVQPPLKLRGSKWCLVSSLVFIEYSIGQQRLWSKNFCQGEGGVQAWLFFSSPLVSQFYKGCPMVISNQTIIFQGFRGGPTFFRGGGVQHIPGGGGGGKMLISIETHMTWFSGRRSGRLSPFWIRTRLLLSFFLSKFPPCPYMKSISIFSCFVSRYLKAGFLWRDM